MSEDHDHFSALVDLAMAAPGLSTMRPVVEKELLHYEIFQALDAEGLLKGLVFQGGTCLRLCRGSDRYSEDLDFAGGKDFSADSMERIKSCVEARIGTRLGLNVTVHSKPAKAGEDGIPHVRVDKWWIVIETAPENPAMPRQKIKLEVANVPAHTRELVPLRANYEFLQGMPTVLVNAESLAEIMADKVLAFPTSLLNHQGQAVAPDSARIRHRDIWDLAWLSAKGVKLVPELVVAKIADFHVTNYPTLLRAAIAQLPAIVESHAFRVQMTRFIDSTTVGRTLATEGYTGYLAMSVGSLFQQTHAALDAQTMSKSPSQAPARTGTPDGAQEKAESKSQVKRKRPPGRSR